MPDHLIRKKNFQAAAPWILPVFFLLAWIAVSEFELIPSYLLPHPLEVSDAGYNYIFGKPGETLYSGRFFRDAAASLSRVVLGFLTASAIGLPLGVISGRIPTVQKILSTSINALRAVPGITWLPLALVWFGIGMKTTVFLVALAAFFPIYLNAAAGARHVNPLLLRAGAMMGVNRFRGVFSILLPGAMPHIMTGLRLGLGISWAYLVLGELTGVPDGLGAIIMDARMLGRIDVIVVGVIIIAAMGRGSDLFLKYVMKLSFKSAARMT